MPNYKFYYFDARARGEPVRMLFEVQGQEYEDIRISEEDWATKFRNDRTRFPLRAMPVLEEDGRILITSKAIARYIGRKFGYYGVNAEDDYITDVCIDISADIEVFITPAFEEKDDTKMSEFLVKGRDGGMKPFFDTMTDLIKKGGGKYIAGERFTLGDIFLYNILDFFLVGRFTQPGYFAAYPEIQNYYDSIQNNSPLTAYLKKRPTPYL